jgi:hypothetical protein
VIQDDDWHLSESQLAGSQETTVARDDPGVTVYQDRSVETELRDGRSDLRHLLRRVGTRVARVGRQPVDRPDFDAPRHCGHHGQGAPRILKPAGEALQWTRCIRCASIICAMQSTIAVIGLWVAILSLAVAVIRTVTAIISAYNMRQLHRTSLLAAVGVVDAERFANTPKAFRNRLTSILVYLLDVPKNAYAIPYFAFRLTNDGRRAIKNVRVQLEFPTNYLLSDNTVLKFEDFAAVLRKPKEAPDPVHRIATVLEGVARVSFELPILRPGESFGTVEPLKFTGPELEQAAQSSEFSWFRPAALHQRLRRIPDFIDMFRLRLFVFCEDREPIKRSVDVYAFEHHGAVEPAEVLGPLEDAIWIDAAPKSGDIYFSPWSPLKLTREMLEIVFPRFDADADGRLCRERLLEGDLAIADLNVPRWDYRYDSRPHSLGIQLKHGIGRARNITYMVPRLDS